MGSKSANRTTDHNKIRNWVEQRKGIPASVAGTAKSGQSAGLLRIDFPEYGEPDTLEPIEWDEFFGKFEESNLAFLYDEDPKSYFLNFYGDLRKMSALQLMRDKIQFKSLQ